MINDSQINNAISAWAERRYDDVDFGKLIEELRSSRKEVQHLKNMLESYRRFVKDNNLTVDSKEYLRTYDGHRI